MVSKMVINAQLSIEQTFATGIKLL